MRIKITSKSERGSVMIETTFSIFVFAIVLLFMLYFYEALNTGVAVQIDSGIDMRNKLIQSNYSCYRRVTSRTRDRVELRYNINAFVPASARPIEIESNKVAYSGACPGVGRSRFDNSRSRQARGPGAVR